MSSEDFVAEPMITVCFCCSVSFKHKTQLQYLQLSQEISNVCHFSFIFFHWLLACYKTTLKSIALEVQMLLTTFASTRCISGCVPHQCHRCRRFLTTGVGTASPLALHPLPYRTPCWPCITKLTSGQCKTGSSVISISSSLHEPVFVESRSPLPSEN